MQVDSGADPGNKFVYKTSATTLPAPRVGDRLTSWTDLPGDGSIAAVDGHDVYVAEVNAATNAVVKFGSATAVVLPHLAPSIAEPIDGQTAIIGPKTIRTTWKQYNIGGGDKKVDLSAVFEDENGDVLTYSAVSDDDTIASVTITGDELIIHPIVPGDVTVRVTAKDPTHLSVDTSFSVTVSGADLEGLDLSNANLKGVNLSYANVKKADLSYAELKGANLSHADLSQTELTFADFSNADLSNANLNQSEAGYGVFYEADVSNATFRDAFLAFADFRNANRSGTDFTGADTAFVEW
ncbi:pentapeptide repeat-containing protein [Brevibacillus humidisoli]|uniref:pentapeptide repeat-containing protein n=1 Tax=Brevibacillus humidisoli TaxID=2895522 RepID=UPI001E45DE9D|nr:pentapeptide repeat-containing protein [Brevibacillus humidisoli]UFJ40128.1 pentapeptide repeat-containing protein [Brevibacillus humidisoli]